MSPPSKADVRVDRAQRIQVVQLGQVTAEQANVCRYRDLKGGSACHHEVDVPVHPTGPRELFCGRARHAGGVAYRDEARRARHRDVAEVEILAHTVVNLSPDADHSTARPH